MAHGFETLDFHDFHRTELPRRLAAGHGALAAPALGQLGALAFRLPDGDAYTYRPGSDGVDVQEGESDAATVIELSPASLRELADGELRVEIARDPASGDDDVMVDYSSLEVAVAP